MNDDRGVHPEAAAIIDALIASAADDLTPVSLDDDALARFACGWTTEAERTDAIMALVASKSHRERLLKLTEEIKRAEVGPAERAEAFRRCPAVARVLQSALTATVNLYSNWSASCRMIAESESEDVSLTRSARAAMARIGERLMATPGPALALGRGSEQRSHVIVHPGDVTADLRVSCVDNDSIEAHAEFESPFLKPAEVSLYLVEPDGAWVWLGSSIADGKRWRLKTQGYWDLLELPPGTLNSMWFALSVGRWFVPRSTINLRISERLRRKDSAPYIRLNLNSTPAIRGGKFKVEIECPDAIRTSYAGSNINVALEVGATVYMLGSWPLNSLSRDRYVELNAPAPGLPDCELEMSGAVRLYLA